MAVLGWTLIKHKKHIPVPCLQLKQNVLAHLIHVLTEARCTTTIRSFRVKSSMALIVFRFPQHTHSTSAPIS